jgi:hypothetical protein
MIDGEYVFDATIPLAVSVVAWVSMVVAGSLGWTLVQTHHVGIKPALVRADQPSREPELQALETRVEPRVETSDDRDDRDPGHADALRTPPIDGMTDPFCARDMCDTLDERVPFRHRARPRLQH